MKKIYYILSLALATGFMASCSNDPNGTDELLPNDKTELPEFNDTRNFPEADDAGKLSGTAAQKLRKLLIRADESFYTSFGNFQPLSNFQYQEIKEFADGLVAGKETEYDKYRAIFTWITKNITYNNAPGGPEDNEPYNVFINKKCVCQGYANLLNVMLISQEIPVINANGYFLGLGHAWNYVGIKNNNGKLTWYLSDPTNNREHNSASFSEYGNEYFPLFADGNIHETEEFSFNYANETLNLTTVKTAGEVLVVPYSVTFVDGYKYQLDSFDPKTDLPSTVKEIYLGANITSLGSNNLYGLNEHAPNVEAAHVDPKNPELMSYCGVVYHKNMIEPIYVPAAMKRVELKLAETYGKETIKAHANLEEIVFLKGTKKIEDWAVEKCPNLKVAYVPVDAEVSANAFSEVHPSFQIIREDQTGIKDVIAD